MNNFENIYKIDSEDSPRVSFSEFQLKMIRKFSPGADEMLLKSDVPFIVHRDLSIVGAVTQPVEGGHLVSWLDPSFLAQLSDQNSKPLNLKQSR